ELQRAALAIAADKADGDERQQKRRSDFARAERRRPDADERGERFADAGGRAAESADFGIRPHRADERHADERSHRDEHHPPRARYDELAPLLGEQPSERTAERDAFSRAI